MQTKHLQKLFSLHQEKEVSHRYIHNGHIVPLLQKLASIFKVDVIGKSVNNQDIFSVTFGSGPKKMLFWSQMHGNESTTTKALFDLFNLISSDEESVTSILNKCTIVVIPILNPDGAKAYTRSNANDIDLNRDAQHLSQPESRALRDLYNSFKPDFCFNLHGQRTIFSVGSTNNPATVSFLAPAQDENCTVTPNRKRAMEVIVSLNMMLQEVIPNQVGIYDDAYNMNCVGDTFQTLNTPTILFEAGHFANDYSRDSTREFIFMALLKSINYIAHHKITGKYSELYADIPENKKLFYDVIIRNALFINNGKEELKDVAIQFNEVLEDNRIEFAPKVEKISGVSNFYAHKEIHANRQEVLTAKKQVIYEGYENDFVSINDELLSVK